MTDNSKSTKKTRAVTSASDFSMVGDKISLKGSQTFGPPPNSGSGFTPLESSPEVAPVNSQQEKINALLAQALRDQEIQKRHEKITDKIAKAQVPVADSIDIFDPRNLQRPNVSQDSHLHEPVTDYGKKSKKFRFIPTSVFGIAAALTMLGVGGFTAHKIHQAGIDGAAIHAQMSQSQNQKEMVVGADVVKKGDQTVIVPKTAMLERLPNDAPEVKQIQTLTVERFNNILTYMDTLASKTAATSNENWHMVQFGMSQGVIKSDKGLELLKNSKFSHEKFLKQLQSDKDDMIVFYQGALKGEDVFYRNAGMKSSLDAAFAKGSKNTSTLVNNTPMEKTLYWYNQYLSNPGYADTHIDQNRKAINAALGHMQEKAKVFSYNQMATGVESNYKSIKLDASGEAKELVGPNTKVDATKSVPDILSAYKAQVPKFNESMRDAQMQNARKYDALAEKAHQVVQEFNKKAQEVAQEATQQPSSRKP